MSAPTKLQPVVKRFPESDWSTGSGVRLPNSDWLKPHAAAITVERPVSVCYKEVLPELCAQWKMASWCVRAVRQSYSLVASPALIR